MTDDEMNDLVKDLLNILSEECSSHEEAILVAYGLCINICRASGLPDDVMISSLRDIAADEISAEIMH